MGQSLAIPRVIPEDWKRLDLIVNKIKLHLGSAASPTHAGLTLSGLTASTLIGANASKVLESVTVGTGLDYTRPNLTLSHLGIEALTDPDADKILFWDDTASACKWLGMGNSVAITDVTLDTIQDIRTTASPTYVGLTLSGISDTQLLYSNSGVLTGSTYFTIESEELIAAYPIRCKSGYGVVFYDDDNSHYAGITAPSAITTNKIYRLPIADGSANNVLATDGAGQLSWVAGNVAGSDKYIQYNASGAHGADSSLYWDYGASPTALHIAGNVLIHPTGGSVGELRFHDAASSDYVGFKSPAAVGVTFVWALPTADGAADQVLKTDGSANLGWTTIDEKVKVDSGATADYIGAAGSDGVLRVDTGMKYADGGDFVTLGGFTSRCRVGLDGDQTLGTASTDIVEFDDEDFDTDNEWDSANYKFVATTAGQYLIAWDIFCNVLGNGTTYIMGYIFKNNVQQSSKAYYPEAAPMSGYVGGVDVMELAANDYITIKARQNSGVDKTLTAFSPNKLNWVAIHRLS